MQWKWVSQNYTDEIVPQAPQRNPIYWLHCVGYWMISKHPIERWWKVAKIIMLGSFFLASKALIWRVNEEIYERWFLILPHIACTALWHGYFFWQGCLLLRDGHEKRATCASWFEWSLCSLNSSEIFIFFTVADKTSIEGINGKGVTLFKLPMSNIRRCENVFRLEEEEENIKAIEEVLIWSYSKLGSPSHSSVK